MPRTRGSRGEEDRIARTEMLLFPTLVRNNHCTRDDMGDFVLGIHPLAYISAAPGAANNANGGLGRVQLTLPLPQCSDLLSPHGNVSLVTEFLHAADALVCRVRWRSRTSPSRSAASKIAKIKPKPLSDLRR